MKLWTILITLVFSLTALAESVSTAELSRHANGAIQNANLTANGSKGIVIASEGNLKAVLVESSSSPSSVMVATSGVSDGISSDFTHSLLSKFTIAFVNDKNNMLGSATDSTFYTTLQSHKLLSLSMKSFTLSDKNWTSLSQEVNEGSELQVMIIPENNKFNREVRLQVGDREISSSSSRQLHSGAKMMTLAMGSTPKGEVKVMLKEESKEDLINSKLTIIITANNSVLFAKEQMLSARRLIRANKSRLKKEEAKDKPNASLVKKYKAIIEREETRLNRLQRLIRSKRTDSWN